jgi:hypothetical protein
LTKAEQKQAFLNAMLDAGEAKLSTMGEETDSAAVGIEKLQAAFADAKTGVAVWAAELVNAAIDLNALAETVREFPGWLDTHTKAFGAAQEAWITGGDAIAAFDRTLTILEGSMIDSTHETARLAALNRDVTVTTIEATTAVGAWEQGMSTAIIPTVQAASAWERLGFAMDAVVVRSPEVQAAVDAANVKMHEQALAAEAATLGIDGLLPPSVAFTEQLEIMAEKEEEAAIEAQKLTEEAEILSAMAGDTFVAAAGDAIAETDVWSMALFEAADAAGADEQELALLAAGLGIYTDEQIEAALATVALSTTIDQLGTAIANGTLTTAEAIFELRKQIDLMQFSIGVTTQNTSTTRRASSATRQNTRERQKAAKETRELARAEKELQRALARTGDFFVDYFEEQEIATEGADKWAVALFEAADAAGADANELALLAGALGLYTDEQVKAALTAAAMQEKMELLGAEIAEGLGMDEAMAKFAEFRQSLNLPAWLEPGSMTPLEVGIRGIASAMRELATVEMPAMQAGLARWLAIG